jgi:hypothetical protein
VQAGHDRYWQLPEVAPTVSGLSIHSIVFSRLLETLLELRCGLFFFSNVTQFIGKPRMGWDGTDAEPLGS